MKKVILFICWFLPVLLMAQTSKMEVTKFSAVEAVEQKQVASSAIDYKNVSIDYLEGAVEVIDDRVVFRHSIPLWEQSPRDVFNKLINWEHRFSSFTEIEQVYADSTKYELALLVKDKLKFKPSAVYVEESDVSFNLLLKVYPTHCEVTIRNIRYSYIEAHKEIRASAEKMITDKVALEKDGKLSRYYDKFRVHTLDYIWNLEKVLESYIGIEKLGDLRGFSKIEKIPTNFNNILVNDLTLLTYYAKGIQNVRVRNGELSYSSGENELMLEGGSEISIADGDVFTVSFYTEVYREKLNCFELSSIRTSHNGFAYSEAWMILECRKIGSNEGKIKAEVLSVWSK